MAKKKNMKSESESESKSKSKSTSKSKSDLSKKKNATKGNRLAKRGKLSFFEELERDTAAFAKTLASHEAYEAERVKRELRIFKKRCQLLGYSFIPSEEKLLDFYLRSKNSSKEIANCPIEEVDVYANHPKCLIGKNCPCTGGKVGYFFTRSRPNEIQSSSDKVQGHWIFIEKEDVFNQEGKKLGVKQVFEYCEGDHCIGYKIIEYQLDPAPIDPKAWFVCKLWDDENCRVVQSQA